MEQLYNNRVIAFLDILGFKDLVNKSSYNVELQNKLKSVVEHLNKIKLRNYDSKYNINESVGCEVSNFSDSIIISYPLDRNHGGGLFQIIMDCLYLQIELAQVGIYVRGAITSGALYHNERSCFGPALIKAVELEAEMAKYPRIIIEKKCLDDGKQYVYGNNTIEFESETIDSLITKSADNDNIFFINYLVQDGEFHNHEEYCRFLLNHYKDIRHNVHSDISNSVKTKYQWLRHYFYDQFGKDGMKNLLRLR